MTKLTILINLNCIPRSRAKAVSAYNDTIVKFSKVGLCSEYPKADSYR